MAAKVTSIIGARKNSVANGLHVAGCRSSKICVKAHLKPEKNALAMTNAKPSTSKAVSPATIITTPIVIVPMMRISFQEGVSSRKRKAKSKTNASAEDLHIVRKVNVMKRREVLPRPMSSEVAVPHGTRRVK